MRFEFRLEKILNLVRLKETVKKMEVASVVQKINYLQNRKNSIQGGIRELLEKAATNLSTQWFSFQNTKIEMDVHEQKRIDSLLLDERAELSERQKELEAIMLRRKSLEALKEKRLKEHKLVQGRKVQKQLDEIYQLTKGRT